MKILQIASILLFSMSVYAQCPKLIWSDEFNGTALDQTKWSYQLGDGCDINLCQWGNNELQWYTNAKENIDVSNGTLKIKALRQNTNNRAYTSGRIRTFQKADFTYGRIEARMKMPIGQGIWPALWMMPTENVYGTWPLSGELDIMEYLGHEPNKVHGTLHFGNPWPNNQSTTKSISLPISKLNDDFHDYVIEWKENEIKWIIDGYVYSTKTPSDLNGQRWPFDQKFHFILNMAVGGNWPGNPNSSTIFPQTFEIDYVRMYEYHAGPTIKGLTTIGANTKGVQFTVESLPAGSTILWSTTEGITISAGQNSNKVSVDFSSKSGIIKANVKTPCAEFNLALEVLVQAPLQSDIILENYDLTPRIKKTLETGVLTEKIANPSKKEPNASNLSGRYIRNANTQFDVLIYDIDDVKLAADFVTGEKKFYIDIYTSAPIGTQILLQLENKNSATSTNYPSGRHSRFTVNTSKQNEWERLSFNFLDRPDNGVSDFGINQLILLFAPNTFTNHTFYIDNFEIYSRKTTSLRSSLAPNKIKVYPNPFGASLVVQSEGKWSHKLINTAGTIVANFNSSNTMSRLHMQSLSQGIYFLVSNNLSGESSFRKLIKQ